MTFILWLLGLSAAAWFARRQYRIWKERKFIEEHLAPYAGLTWQPKKSREERKMEEHRRKLGY